MWTRTNGRNTRPAPDTSDPRGMRVDVEARVAWLLRTNRMGSPFGDTCSSLSDRLSAAGYRTNTSWLSRRETGNQPIPMDLLAAVERQLHLPDGHLVGTARYLRIMLRSVRPASAVAGSQVLPHTQRDLDRVADAVHDGAATAADWMTLADLLSSGRVVVPRTLLQSWVRALVVERSRVTGGGYAARTAALAELLGTPSIEDPVASAVRLAAGEPGALQVADTYAVLGCSSAERTQLTLIRQLRSSSGARRTGAARALLQALSTSSVQRPVAELLESTVRDLAGSVETADVAVMVARRLSVSAHRAVHAAGYLAVDAVTDTSLRTWVKPYLRAASEVSGMEDPMLERLLTEALDPRRDVRRRHAAVLIGMTPYAGALAGVAKAHGGHTASAVLRSYLAGPLLTELPDRQAAVLV